MLGIGQYEPVLCFFELADYRMLAKPFTWNGRIGKLFALYSILLSFSPLLSAVELLSDDFKSAYMDSMFSMRLLNSQSAALMLESFVRKPPTGFGGFLHDLVGLVFSIDT